MNHFSLATVKPVYSDMHQGEIWCWNRWGVAVQCKTHRKLKKVHENQITSDNTGRWITEVLD